VTEFLTLEDVLRVHERALLIAPGDPAIRSQGGLEAAVAMPQSGFGDVLFHSTVFEQAAAYAYHIAESQAFVDGNKRTGVMARAIA